ncbi:hypothetical protein FA95DRAFT_1577475, partial [Auriscalpium vulgare]
MNNTTNQWGLPGTGEASRHGTPANNESAGHKVGDTTSMLEGVALRLEMAQQHKSAPTALNASGGVPSTSTSSTSTPDTSFGSRLALNTPVGSSKAHQHYQHQGSMSTAWSTSSVPPEYRGQPLVSTMDGLGVASPAPSAFLQ